MFLLTKKTVRLVGQTEPPTRHHTPPGNESSRTRKGSGAGYVDGKASRLVDKKVRVLLDQDSNRPWGTIDGRCPDHCLFRHGTLSSGRHPTSRERHPRTHRVPQTTRRLPVLPGTRYLGKTHLRRGWRRTEFTSRDPGAGASRRRCLPTEGVRLSSHPRSVSPGVSHRDYSWKGTSVWVSGPRYRCQPLTRTHATWKDLGRPVAVTR